MPTCVAWVERNRKLLLERADVMVELLDQGHWRGRFLALSIPAGPYDVMVEPASAGRQSPEARLQT